MSKTAKWILAAVIVLLAAGAAFAVYAHRLLSEDFSVSMPADGQLTLEPREDGALRLSWPAAEGAAGYRVEVRGYPDGPSIYSAPRILWENEGDEASCLLPPSLPTDRELTLCIYARSERTVLRQDQVSYSPEPRSLRCSLACPRALDVSLSPDPGSQTAVVSWSGAAEDEYSLYCRRTGEEGAQKLRQLSGNRALLTFGEDGELPLPLRGEELTFWLEASRETAELHFPGLKSGEASLSREDLLGTELKLQCTPEDENSFLLSWNETKGETCLIQRLDEASGEWETLAELPAGGERVYHTGHLEPFGTYRYRLSVLGGQAEGAFAVTPEEAEVQTAETLRFAAVWPLMELDIFASPDGQEKIGSLSPLRAACVLGEENGYLLVGTPEGSGYVDENYCMIDLPDYVGSLCDYSIWNSVSAIYSVHGYPVRGVTGTVVKGYEAVALPDGGYLVPLLYPTAQKLISAARALLAEGYRLRIYDSFRPHVATRSVYELTTAILNDPVSEEEDALTYEQLMTGDRYQLWDFLAANISKHNRGIAMDVALLRLSDGEELKMQSSLHDLSWYSATPYNDANAKFLASFMVEAGFGTLHSEWWHFQDMEALAALDPPCRNEGVTPEGWRADDRGWRYRCADGSFLAGEKREIDGKLYDFGDDGYLIP